MSNKIKAILFDFDGVLIDSSLACMQEILDTIRDLGLKSPGLEFIRERWGIPYDEIMRDIQLHCDWSDDDLRRYYETLDAFESKRDLFPGTANLIYNLDQLGIQRCVISSRKTISLIERMKDVQLNPGEFCLVQGLDDCKVWKPDPSVFDKAFTILEEMEITKDETAFIGDTKVDFKATKNAGIAFIARCSGAVTKKEFEKLGVDPSMIVSDSSEILDIITREQA